MRPIALRLALSIMVLPASINSFVLHPKSVIIPHKQLRATPVYMGILNRFRKKRKVEQVTPVVPGDEVKDIDVERIKINEDGTVDTEPISIRELLGDTKTILLGMPGAFTPTCSEEHLPGYANNAGRFAALGYENIIVVTTNDKFVNKEWMCSQGLLKPDSKITMVSDGDGELVKSLGLADDMGFGVGVRSKRFALVAEKGVVLDVLTDEGMDVCDVTSADNLLKKYTPDPVVSDSDEANPVVLGGYITVAIALGLALQTLGGGGTTTPTTSPNAAPVVKVTEQVKEQPTTSRSEESFALIKDFVK